MRPVIGSALWSVFGASSDVRKLSPKAASEGQPTRHDTTGGPDSRDNDATPRGLRRGQQHERGARTASGMRAALHPPDASWQEGTRLALPLRAAAAAGSYGGAPNLNKAG